LTETNQEFSLVCTIESRLEVVQSGGKVDRCVVLLNELEKMFDEVINRFSSAVAEAPDLGNETRKIIERSLLE